MDKLCRGCNETKPTSEFYRHGSTKDGLQPRCKSCIKLYQKRRKEERQQPSHEEEQSLLLINTRRYLKRQAEGKRECAHPDCDTLIAYTQVDLCMLHD